MLFIAAKIAVLAATSSLPAVDVSLTRPFEAGQVFSYAAVGRTYRQTIVSTEGAVVEESVRGLRCELAAAVEVVSVFEGGRPHELAVRVFRLVVGEGFRPGARAGAIADGEEPLAAGFALAVTYPELGGAAPEIRPAGGEELDAAAVEALRLVLPSPAGGRDDDSMFGCRQPVRFGERWGIDRDRAARALRGGGLEIDPEQLTGEVALVAIGGGGDYRVRVDLQGRRAGVPLPDGYATRAGDLRTRLALRLPADPAMPPLGEDVEYSLRSHALGREGERLMAVDMVFYQTCRARYRLVGDDS